MRRASDNGMFQGLDVVEFGSGPVNELEDQSTVAPPSLFGLEDSQDTIELVSEHESDSSHDKVSEVTRSESPSSASTEDDEWRGRRRDFRMYVTWEQFQAAIRALTRKRALESLFAQVYRNFERIRASTRRFAARQLTDMYVILTHRALLWREHKKVAQAARARFRKKHKPWFACDRCIMTFGFPLLWKQHAAQGCKPKHVRAMVEALQFRTRWDKVPAHFDFDHPQGTGKLEKLFVPVTVKGKIAPIA